MKYVALLRGINVGGNCKIEMAALRAVFEALGYTDVRSYINSGNILFSSESPPSASAIESVIAEKFGFTVPTLVLDQSTFEAVATAIPADWANDSLQKTDVLFLRPDVAHPESVDLIIINPAVDTLLYAERAIIWHIDRAHYNQSKMGDFIKNPLYRQMTARNCNTVRKLVELMQ
jgi:uncharacterized protein (DUF1697 family)